MTGRWLVFSFVALGVFLTTSGLTIVNVALPFITEDFDADIGSAQWILLGYLLATSSTLINFGRLGDLVGSLRIHSIGFWVFITASLLCSFAVSVEMLIGFRVAQALGASMIIATGPGIITASFPAEQRGKAVGLQGIVVGASLSLGPTVGGFLTGFFGWRSVFLFNVPIGLLGLLISTLIKGPAQQLKKVEIDIPGSLLFFAAIACFVLATHRSRAWGWSSPMILALLTSAVLLTAFFILVERKKYNPMLDLSLFRNQVFTLAQAGNYISNMTMFSVLFLVPFYLVQVREFSAETVGLVLLPLPLTMVFGGPISGYLTDRMGTKWLSILSMILLCSGLFSLTTLDQDSSAVGIMMRLILLGSGRAFYRSPNLTAVLSSIGKDRLGVAGGIYATMRHLGNISGVALLGSFFNARSDYAPGAPPDPSRGLSAFQETFFIGLGVGLVGFVLALFQEELKTSGQPPGRSNAKGQTPARKDGVP